MKSPRVHVTLEPKLYDVIGGIAVRTKQSRSGFIAGMLQDNYEVLTQMLSMLNAVAALQEDISLSTDARLSMVAARAVETQGDARLIMDQALDLLRQEKNRQHSDRGTVPASSGRGAAGGTVCPPASNRGANYGFRPPLEGAWKDL